MMAITINPGATSCATGGTCPGWIALTTGPPAATRTSKKVPKYSENRRRNRHSNLQSWGRPTHGGSASSGPRAARAIRAAVERTSWSLIGLQDASWEICQLKPQAWPTPSRSGPRGCPAIEQVREKFVDAAVLLDDVGGAILALTSFPKEHRQQIRSNKRGTVEHRAPPTHRRCGHLPEWAPRLGNGRPRGVSEWCPHQG